MSEHRDTRSVSESLGEIAGLLEERERARFTAAVDVDHEYGVEVARLWRALVEEIRPAFAVALGGYLAGAADGPEARRAALRDAWLSQLQGGD